MEQWSEKGTIKFNLGKYRDIDMDKGMKRPDYEYNINGNKIQASYRE